MDGETGARARSAMPGNILHFTNIPEYSMKYRKLEYFSSDWVKCSG
ncbi:hypothetical protein [Thiolapillus sp.]